MQPKLTLLGGVALSAVLTLGFTATADAKAVKHHHAAAADDRLSALTSEVETLEGRLEAESLAREQLQSQVQAAQSQAAAAQADAASAHAQLQEQIQTIPGVVSTAVAANKPKPSWTDNTKVGATIFADVSDVHQGPGPVASNGSGADLKRAYLAIDHKFNDIFSANLTVDFAPNGVNNNSTNATYGKGLQGSEAVKYVYVQANLNPALILQAGSAKMPWIPFVEDIYGQRYVEHVLTDFNKVGNSADYGVFASGAFAGGLLNYSVAGVDGAGYKNAVRSKGMDVEGRVNLNYDGFIAGIGGYTGDLSKNYETTAYAPTTYATATRIDALVAYTSPLFHAGFEYFQANNYLTLAVRNSRDRQTGYSIFGTYNFMPKFAVFGRYDWGNPHESLARSEDENYYNIGVQYEPVKVVDLALVYKHAELNHVENGLSYAVSDVTLAAPNGSSAKYDEFGLFTQFKF